MALFTLQIKPSQIPSLADCPLIILRPLRSSLYSGILPTGSKPIKEACYLNWPSAPMQDAVKVMAKSLVRNRHAVTKMYSLKSQLQAVSLRMAVSLQAPNFAEYSSAVGTTSNLCEEVLVACPLCLALAHPLEGTFPLTLWKSETLINLHVDELSDRHQGVNNLQCYNAMISHVTIVHPNPRLSSQTLKSTQAMADAMRGATKVMNLYPWWPPFSVGGKYWNWQSYIVFVIAKGTCHPALIQVRQGLLYSVSVGWNSSLEESLDTYLCSFSGEVPHCSDVNGNIFLQAMGMMNKQLNMPALQKIMREFERQNERMEMTSDMMGDAIDDAFEVG